MADVTINDLGSITPLGTSVIPISDGTTTGKASIASLQVDYANIASKPNFASVATTGSYNDLSNRPSVLVQTLVTSNCTQQTSSSKGVWYDILTLPFTPKYTNSKIVIKASVPLTLQGIDGAGGGIQILKNGVSIHSNRNAVYYFCATANFMSLTAPATFIDTNGSSLATITYKVQWIRSYTARDTAWGGNTSYANYLGGCSYLEVSELTA